MTATDQQEAIRAKGLTKRLGTTTAVDGLDLTVANGETFALLGVNGASKSTTIALLTGLERPTSGTATILGMPITSDMARIKPHINLAPQQTAAAQNLTVRENLALIAGLYGQSRTQARHSTDAMLTQFDLDQMAHQRAHTLSGGMQRRLSIAMGLITNPKILFLDEPTVGLDVFARHALWHTLTALKGRVTILLTTHYLEEVEALADHIGIMVAGASWPTARRTNSNSTAANPRWKTRSSPLQEVRMHWHDITLFSGRTMKEVLRDPANLFFGFAFPVLLLWALSVIYHQVGRSPAPYSWA